PGSPLQHGVVWLFMHDLFISYAHRDNQQLDSNKGWIDLLHERLELRLGQLLGEDPNIWRDRKLRGCDYFDDEIFDHLLQSTLLISILSPGYIKSEWCPVELREFHRQAEADGRTHLCSKSRIFKVHKTPVNYSAHPEELQRLLGYDFFFWTDSEQK